MAKIYIPILEYHDLGKKKEGKKTFHSPYVLDPGKFHDHLQWLREHDFQTISIDDLFERKIKQQSVIITFDDGHLSNYEHALPLLRKFDFKATFFLVGNFVGSKENLTIDQIREMREEGMDFGSHSLTHPYLLALNRKQTALELSRSKAVIEEIVKKEIRHFCIPYGFYNNELLRCIENAGFKSAVTERMGYYFPDNNSFKVLPRFTIKSGITLADFKNIMLRNRSGMIGLYITETILHGAKKALGFKGYMRLKRLLFRAELGQG